MPLIDQLPILTSRHPNNHAAPLVPHQHREIQAQKLLNMVCRKAVIAVKTATEGKEALPYLLRLCQKFFRHEEIRCRIVIAAAIIGQVIRRRLRHGIVPLFGNAHAENHSLGNACHIHSGAKGRSPYCLSFPSRSCPTSFPSIAATIIVSYYSTAEHLSPAKNQ